MRSRITGVAVLLLILTGFTVGADATLRYVEDASIDAPDQHVRGEELVIGGSATGSGLEKIKIERYISNDLWEEVGSKDCVGDSCSISSSYTGDDRGEEMFRVKARAGTDERSETKVIEFIDKDEEERYVGDVDIEVESDRVKLPGAGKITADAEGKKLDRLYIEKKPSSGSWSRLGTTSCSGSSCALTRYHTPEETGDFDYRAWAEAGDDEESSGTKTITYYRDNDKQSPVADLDVRPSTAEIGESITFDASESYDPDGEIVEYRYDFQNDGTWDRTTSSSSVSESFRNEFSGYAKLEVVDDDGLTDTDTTYYRIEEDGVSKDPEPEPEKCGIRKSSVGSLNLGDNRVERGESTDASISVGNTGDAQKVEVEIFAYEEGSYKTFYSTDTTISKDSSRTFSTDVSLEQYGYIRAKVVTRGDPCGYQRFERSKMLSVIGESGKDGESELRVNVKDTEDNSLEDARVRVENSDRSIKYTGSSGDAYFNLRPGDYEVRVSKPGYRTETRSVYLEEDSFRRLDFKLEKDSLGEFEAIVRDMNGDRLRDAKVRVENSETRTRYTDHDGRASFSLVPDKYDVKVSKDGYSTEDTVTIEKDKKTTRLYHLRTEDEKTGLHIKDIDYPDTVCRGGSMKADVTVENLGGYHEIVTLTGSGLGSITVGESFSMKEGETVQRSIRFTGVEGDGDEKFKITATNRVTDRIRGSVKVEDCDTVSGKDATHLTAELKPREVVEGESVNVKGYVRGVKGRSTVTVDINGREEARINTQPDGYYNVYIRPENVGRQSVTVSSGGKSVTRTLNVVPTSYIESVTAPEKVFEGETFEVCTHVSSQVTPKVYFTLDDRVLETRNSKGEICFERTASDPGVHEYSIRSLTQGQESRGSVTVEVLETRSEFRQFPHQIASVKTGSGIVKVDLYNTDQELKRYQASITGIPDTWVAQSEKEVILDRGQSETVYFYFTPRAEGTFEPDIQIRSGGNLVYEEKVTMEIVGRQADRKKSLLERFTGLFRRN